ncbi:CsbD family protein [Nocardia brasiliensis]|uniref:microaggregate-binding protein 1 n=1 Tax=Nocardia brasiliensis TaxID=37326 RepID=UPI00366C6674
MSEQGSGPREGVEGVVEDVKGKTKEAAGIVTGDENLKGEGRAQQDKAESEREVAQKEAAAEKARAEAKMDEARQAGHQNQ